MAIYDTRLGEIINALGRYYSIVSKDKFMPLLAFGGDDAIGSFGTVNFDPSPEIEKLVSTFSDATEGGTIMIKNFNALKDILSSADDPSSSLDEETVKQAMTLFRYHGDPNAFESIMTEFERVCSKISINDMCRITPSSTGNDGMINGAFASPTKFTPNLCALEVFNPKLVPAVRDTGAAGLFMNAIPTLEFSRCQPCLDITLVSPNTALNSDGRIQTIGLMQQLLGQSVPGDGDKALAQAIDMTAVQGRLEEVEASAAAGEVDTTAGDYTASSGDLSVSTAGMEMFTAPQTLVPVLGNGMETYGDFEAYQITEPAADGSTTPSITAGGRRGAPIIDPFRPLMSIEDFNITVTPSKGMMSHKTADLSLVLHDRSRLTEIAEFVKPDLYGKSELMITYGWNHPDNSALTGPGGGLHGNFYGAFLNAMKVTEKYMIVNSSFSFDEVGQVKIKLKLSMKGATNLSTGNISQGEDVEDATSGLKDAIEAIKRVKKEALEDAAAAGSLKEQKDVFGESFFKAASDTSRAMTMDDETAAALKKYISENRGATGTSKDLADSLEKAFGSDGKGGEVAKLQKTIAEAVATKLKHIKSLRKSNKDSFAKAVTGAGGSTKYVNIPKDSRKHVSFGALLMYMIGKPLAATKRFDEIQFIFYPVNDKASYLKDLTTAQIPIKISDFEGVFKENTKTSVNLPLGRFLGMVGKEFIHNQAAEAYGLAALYDTDDEGKKQVKEKLKEDPTKLNDEKKKRLEDAYGEGQEISFKMPRVKFHLEAVPAKDTGHEIGRRATILRIHVYDTVCTPHSALHKMMSAARSNSLGMLTTAASKATTPIDLDSKSSDDADVSVDHTSAFVTQIQEAIAGGLLEPVPSMSVKDLESFDPTAPGADDTYFRIKGGFPALKNFVATSMPSIIYGSTNSAVLSADVSSMNNPQLSTINMMRAGMGGGSSAQGARDAGVPLQTAPVSLSLNTFGCPAINYGQSFFVDFGTGTTIDNVFVVTGIDHSISQGKFETKVKMTQIDAFGKYTSTLTTLTKTLAALKDAGSESTTE